MIKIISLTLITVSLYASQTIKITSKQQSDLGVKTQKVTMVDSISFTPYNGRVVMDKKDVISVSSNIESIVKEIYVSEFEQVKKGQKLLTLKSNALLSLQRDYIESIIESQSASQNYARDLKLESEGIISTKKLLASKKLESSFALRVTLNENQLATNGFTPSMLKKLRDTHKVILEQDVRAVKSGVVYKIDVNIGEYVQSDRMMMGIYANGKRFIELSVPVKIIEDISIGNRCTFSKYSAKIIAIGNVVNESSQSVQVRAEIDNAKGVMINRVYGVKIHKGVEGAVKIKKGALVFQENSSYVFKQVDSGFDVVSVKIISEGPSCYIVKAELNTDDKLAVTSTAALLSAMDSEDE